MNRLLLLLLLPISLFAAQVADNAHLLTSDEISRLSAGPSNPVIETHVSLPDIRSYGDQRAAQLGSREEYGDSQSYAIIVTTNPRAWRISGYPAGNGRETESIGQDMVGYFKAGRFYEGLNLASRRLGNLSVSAPFIPVSESARRAPAAQSTSASPLTIILIGLLVCGAVAGIYFYRQAAKNRAIDEQVANMKREEVRRQQEVIRQQRAAIRAQEEARQASIRQAQQKESERAFEGKKDAVSSEVKEKAKKSWNSYGSAKRRSRVVDVYSPHYHQGVLSDPLAFYLYMSAVSPHQVVYSAPPASDNSSRASHSSSDDDSYRRRSSDSYSSPSSYDSGGSYGSFDSGSSSSDSGGSGGSW
jgi:uncharacterized membrane protein YgcG